MDNFNLLPDTPPEKRSQKYQPVFSFLDQIFPSRKAKKIADANALFQRDYDAYAWLVECTRLEQDTGELNELENTKFYKQLAVSNAANEVKAEHERAAAIKAQQDMFMKAKRERWATIEAEHERAAAIKILQEQQDMFMKAERATKRVNMLIGMHIGTLSLKRDQTLFKDEYGNVLEDKWLQAQDYFINSVLQKDDLISDVLIDSNDEAYRNRSIFRQNIDDAVNEYKNHKTENNSHSSIVVESLSPIEFEHYCADILRCNGWDARVTQAAGDQGIDVIATLLNVKAVLQCKKYSQPIGNKAVQEIIAGKHYEQADIAGVVSNSSYTPSAKRLAKAAGVELLHYTELEQFAEKVGMK